MTPRLKLPAYGKALLNARREGQHPLVVHLIYGEDWRPGERCEELCEEGAHPRLAVKPSEFAPFQIDWALVTGCLVAVFDTHELGTRESRPFYELLGELGRFAGPVHVYRLDDRGRWGFNYDTSVLARGLREKSDKWPFFWPPETEGLNEPRRTRWWELYAAHRAETARAA